MGGLGVWAAVSCGKDSLLPDGGTSGGGDGGGGQSGGGGAGGGDVIASAFAVGSGAFLDGRTYADPFEAGPGSTCLVYPASTEGPCHSNTYHRQELSDGLVGLPTRLELLVLDTACNPMPGAIVEVWYASPAGTYSRAAEAIDAGTGYGGSLADLNVGFCTGNDATALGSKWLRGYQIAGDDGRVTLDGIFPGWYAGRTTHVHFIITANGIRFVTSQLFFDEALTTSVYTQHGAYAARGDKDTSNARDNVIREANLSVSSATMGFSQQSDGALVCWKSLVIAA